MDLYLSRRNFIKMGTIAGISLFIDNYSSSYSDGQGQLKTDGKWISPNGEVKYHWDALSKVMGKKNFAFDLRSKNIDGWPEQQAYAFFIKAIKADRIFEDVHLSVLGDELQPDRLIRHEDLEADEVQVLTCPPVVPRS